MDGYQPESLLGRQMGRRFVRISALTPAVNLVPVLNFIVTARWIRHALTAAKRMVLDCDDDIVLTLCIVVHFDRNILPCLCNTVLCSRTDRTTRSTAAMQFNEIWKISVPIGVDGDNFRTESTVHVFDHS